MRIRRSFPTFPLVRNLRGEEIHGEGKSVQELLRRIGPAIGQFAPRRLTRYLVKEVLHFFVLCLAALTGVLFTVRVLKFSSLIINKGVAIHQIGWVFLSVIPTFLEFALPLATLLGVMLAFARLSGDSEIVVLRASGIGIYQLLRPLAWFTVLVFILSNAVSFSLKPWGHQTLSDALFDIARSKSTAGLEAGTFNRIGALTIYAERISDATGELHGVMIDDRRGKDERKVIFADHGRIISRPANRSIIFALETGSIHEMIGRKYLSTRFVSNSLVLGADELYNPNEKQKGIAPRELSAHKLRIAIPDIRNAESALRQSGVKSRPLDTFPPEVQAHFSGVDLTLAQLTKKRRRLEVELAQRWSMPFATAILAILGLPLGINPPRTQRTWGLGLSVAVGVGVFVVYYGLLSLGLTLVEAGSISAVFGVWLPNLATALMAVALLIQLGSERWDSIADITRLVSLPRFLRRHQAVVSPTNRGAN